MSTFTLIRRSLVHYWRTNLAVLLGVIAATAVIGGALIVGDSVRDSLRQMSLDRLGGVDDALVGLRFFRQQLAEDLQILRAKEERCDELVAPAIVLQAAVVHESDGTTRTGGRRLGVRWADDSLCGTIWR